MMGEMKTTQIMQEIRGSFICFDILGKVHDLDISELSRQRKFFLPACLTWQRVMASVILQLPKVQDQVQHLVIDPIHSVQSLDALVT